jgi:hypothetical protein
LKTHWYFPLFRTHVLCYFQSIDAFSSKGYTPLHLACEGGHTEVAKLLLEHSANPTRQSIYVWSFSSEKRKHYFLLKQNIGLKVSGSRATHRSTWRAEPTKLSS